ncbi:MAG: hypothetical protein IMW99_11255, partial [Firmicutes bacterium]|nr:hypothetical protein [Bacillota bacterium]
MPIQAVTGAEQRLEAGAGSLLCGGQVDRKELWPAILALADGTAFYGQGVGLPAVTGGEVVFNTSMAGYQEILTDPSYAGQIITFTYPLIGNYGTNEIYDQSRRPAARGVILRELGSHPHHWRNEGGLGCWLAEQGLTGIAGIDTRALVRRLREQGTMPGVIGPVEVFRPSSPQPGVSHRPDSSRRPASSVRPDWEEDPVAAAAVTAARRLPSLSEEDLLAEVTCAQPYQVGDPRGLPIVVVDLGSKD